MWLPSSFFVVAFLVAQCGTIASIAAEAAQEHQQINSHGDVEMQQEKQLELRNLLRRTVDDGPGIIRGLFDADLLDVIVKIDWLDFVHRFADALVRQDDTCRSVNFSIAKWEAFVRDGPLLGVAVGYRDVEGHIVNPSIPPPPTRERMAFGVAAGGENFHDGPQLRQALSQPNLTLVIELRNVMEDNNEDSPHEDLRLQRRQAYHEVTKGLHQLEQVGKRHPSDLDLYVAQPNSSSYGWHFDAVDNLVMCVSGTKRFKVAGREMGSAVQIDTVMNPGDALYIPAGYYHQGCGGDTVQSVIWSIGYVHAEESMAILEERQADKQLQNLAQGGDFFNPPIGEDVIKELARVVYAEYLEELAAEEAEAEAEEDKEL